MTKSDSLDYITLDSDDIKTIERFENNYYNHKKKIVQIGGNNKLENNIVRLFNCYLLSQNQIGGGKKSKLTNKIQARLNTKIAELVVNNNYFNLLNDLEGGADELKNDKGNYIVRLIKDFIIDKINNNDDIIITMNQTIKDRIISYIEGFSVYDELKKLGTKQVLDPVRNKVDAIKKNGYEAANQTIGSIRQGVNRAANAAANAFKPQLTAADKELAAANAFKPQLTAEDKELAAANAFKSQLTAEDKELVEKLVASDDKQTKEILAQYNDIKYLWKIYNIMEDVRHNPRDGTFNDRLLRLQVRIYELQDIQPPEIKEDLAKIEGKEKAMQEKAMQAKTPVTSETIEEGDESEDDEDDEDDKKKAPAPAPAKTEAPAKTKAPEPAPARWGFWRG